MIDIKDEVGFVISGQAVFGDNMTAGAVVDQTQLPYLLAAFVFKGKAYGGHCLAAGSLTVTGADIEVAGVKAVGAVVAVLGAQGTV